MGDKNLIVGRSVGKDFSDDQKLDDFQKPVVDHLYYLRNRTVIMTTFATDTVEPDLYTAKLFITKNVIQTRLLIVNIKIHELEAAVPHLKVQHSGGNFAFGNLAPIHLQISKIEDELFHKWICEFFWPR